MVILVVVVLVIAGVLGYVFVSMRVGSGTTTSSSSKTSGYTSTTPVTLQSGGSTFVEPIVEIWENQFSKYSNGYVAFNYQGLGSAVGQQGVFDNTFAYGASDAPVNDSQLAQLGGKTLLQIPETLGGVAIIYNIPSIGNVTVNFSGSVMVGIWDGTITNWDNPQIAALNPTLHFPNATITAVVRADGSGTTYAFTSYFAKIDPAWNETGGPGVGLFADWPKGDVGAQGSSGMAGVVSTIPNSIGYVDQYYAESNGLQVGAVENSAGNFIQPSIATISAAADNFSSQLAANPLFTITDAPGAHSYPLATFSYLLVWKDQTNANTAYAISSFFWWIVNQGQSYSSSADFAPLPPAMVTADEALIAQINYNGQTFFTAPS